MMPMRHFGNTGLKVSALGYGAGSIGDAAMGEKQVALLLNSALDLGVNLFDTAPSYGISEERIGRHLSHRRQDLVLSTKVGYGVPGVPDWTAPVISAGVDQALKKMKTDYLDIVHLHSCPLDVLEQGEVTAALDACVQAGKVRVAAYAGDNEALTFAIRDHRFNSVIASANFCDQQFLNSQLGEAKQRGLGVIAKRPMANAPWRFSERPVGHYVEPYWERFKAMDFLFGSPLDEIALRFVAFTWGIDSCIVGTSSVENLQRNAASIAKGRLDDDEDDHIRARFRERDLGWRAEI